MPRTTNMATDQHTTQSSRDSGDAEHFQPRHLAVGVDDAACAEATRFQPCVLGEVIEPGAQQFGHAGGQAFLEAHQQAEHILEEARRQAARLQQETQDQIEILLLRRAAEETEAVRQEQTARFEQAAHALIEQFRQDAGAALEELSAQVAELAAGITAKIIRRHIAADDRIVLDVVSEALGRLSDISRLRVVINPADEPAIAEHRQELLAQVSGLDGLDIVTDADIERGGCLLDSDRGEVDARLSSQLELIWKRVSASDVLRKTA